MKQRDILVVGSMALDSLETPAGHADACLGGSATFFSVSASYFAPVRVVAVVGDDFPHAHMTTLESRDIDLSGVETVKGGRTFRWRGRYGDNLNEAQTLETQLNVFEHFDPKIPDAHKKAPIVFLGNIAPELQLRVLDQVESPALVAADTMNFWITGQRKGLEDVLARIDLLIINDTEAQLLAGTKNVVHAADHIRAMGPRMLVIKRGEFGSMLFHPDGIFIAPAVALREVTDPTGAGDTFAGGTLGVLAQNETIDFRALKRGIVTGSVMASFTCEGFGLDRLLALDRATIEERVESLHRAMTI